MKSIILRGKAIRPGWSFDAFIVPDTDGLLAIDERHPAVGDSPADWRITHIPTMHSVQRPSYTDLETMERAIAVAQAFYREASALGWDLRSENAEDIAGPHNAMSSADKNQFWKRVAGREPALSEE